MSPRSGFGWIMRSASLFAVTVLAVILTVSLFSPVAAQPAPGLTIRKVTTNGDITTKFPFTISSQIALKFELAGGESESGPLPGAGDYHVVETVPDGWVVTDISCEGFISVPNPSSFTFIPGVGVTIHYVAGDTVACTFTNCPLADCPLPAAVGGVVTTVNTFSVLAPWMAVLGLVGCIGAVVVVAKKRS